MYGICVSMVPRCPDIIFFQSYLSPLEETMNPELGWVGAIITYATQGTHRRTNERATMRIYNYPAKTVMKHVFFLQNTATLHLWQQKEGKKKIV